MSLDFKGTYSVNDLAKASLSKGYSSKKGAEMLYVKNHCGWG